MFNSVLSPFQRKLHITDVGGQRDSKVGPIPAFSYLLVAGKLLACDSSTFLAGYNLVKPSNLDSYEYVCSNKRVRKR